MACSGSRQVLAGTSRTVDRRCEWHSDESQQEKDQYEVSQFHAAETVAAGVI
jgi:hypothetical protein